MPTELGKANFGDVWSGDTMQMRRGEIYSEGGYEGALDEHGRGAQGPSYEIFQQREAIRDILDETGYTDMMMQKEKDKRKKRIENIMEKTGVKKVIGEKLYRGAEGEGEFKPDPEKAKEWNKLSDSDKMMVGDVAQGKMQPEEYTNIKKEQSIATFKNLLELSEQIQLSRDGKKEDLSAKGIQDFAAGAPGVTGRVKPKEIIQRHLGGGRTGGGKTTKPPKKPTSNLQKEMNDAIALRKGHTPESRKFDSEKTPGMLDEVIENRKVAANLQTMLGGPGKIDDNQSKIKAAGIIKAQTAIQKMFKDTTPEMEKEIGNDITFVKPYLGGVPFDEVERLKVLLDKGYTFEEILKRYEIFTGEGPGERSVAAEEETGVHKR